MSALERSRAKLLTAVRAELVNLGQDLDLRNPRESRVVEANRRLREAHERFAAEHELVIHETTEEDVSVAFSVEKDELDSQVEAELVRAERWLQSNQDAIDERAAESERLQAELRDSLAKVKRLERRAEAREEKAEEREKELAAREAALLERGRSERTRKSRVSESDNSDDEDVTAAKQRMSGKSNDDVSQDDRQYLNAGSRYRDATRTYLNRDSEDSNVRRRSPPPSEDSRASSALERVCESMQAQMGLPQPVLKTFGGDPSEYASFIHVFETTVESRIRDNRTRLTFLVQQCRDGAKRAIERCQLLPAEDGYKRARATLKTLYGGKKQVARACLNALLAMGKVKDGDDVKLQSLAIELERASITLSATGYAGEANNSVTIRQVASKLPGSLTRRWLDKIERIERRDAEVEFDDLVEFVTKEAARSKVSSAWAPLPVSNGVVTSVTSSQPGSQPTQAASAGSRRRFNNRRGYNHQSAAALVTSSATSSGMASAKQAARAGAAGNGRSVNGRAGRAPVAQPASQRHFPCSDCGRDCRFLNLCASFKAKSFEQRKRLLSQQNRCSNCLRVGHVSGACPRGSFCLVQACTGKHHSLLHQWTPGTPAVASTARAPVTQAVPALASSGGAYIGVLPVVVEYKGRKTVTLAVIDSGAAKTLCTKRLIDALEIKGRRSEYAIDGINERAVTYSGSQCDFTVHAYEGGASIAVRNAWEVPTLPALGQAQPNDAEIVSYRHLRDVSVPRVAGATVNLLIGTDSILAHRPLECRYGGEREPHAIRSVLGWYVQGPRNDVSNRAVVNFVSISNEQLSTQLKRMYEQDFSEGTSDVAAWSVEDRRASDIMKTSTRVAPCGRFEVALPWRNSEVLPPSRKMAEGRLNSLRRKLSGDDAVRQLYVETVEQYIVDGHAEVAPDEHASGRTWYLPHHGVTSAAKPGKIRVVFDAAAKSCGTSLNDRLLQGPDLVNELVGVLMRFRQGAVAISGDIAKMFHQVRVPERDRDALRFLWWPGGDLSKQPVDYRMCVHVFGATSSPSCAAYALRRAAGDQAGAYDNNIVNTISRDFYVDDCLSSVDTAEEASQVIEGVTSLLSNRGFEITKWISTDPGVIAGVPVERRAKSVVTFELGDQLPDERALGMKWLVSSDVFAYDVNEYEKPLTRRGVLSDVSSLFDPLGLVGPVLLPARRLLQELVQAALGWDETLPAEYESRWCKWRKQLTSLRSLRIPRCYTRGTCVKSDVQLHVFSDASESGYGACAYLRTVNDIGEIYVTLVMGKSRVAPRKAHTLPRLELQAAVVGAKLARHVTRELSWVIDCVYMWTDSMIVIGYLRNESRRFKTFVANRLATIRECTSVQQWRHISGKVNPADIASRGIEANDAANLERWLSGPAFLKSHFSQWPSSEPTLPSLDNDVEVKHDAVVTLVTSDDQATGVSKLIVHYSRYQRLRRAVAWWLRLMNCLQVRSQRRRGVVSAAADVASGALTVTDMEQADTALCRHVQRTVFSEDWEQLTRAEGVKARSQLTPLNPRIVNGVIVVNGRLSRASSLTVQARQPVILPARHHLTTLIVRQQHECDGHVGVNHVLSALRQRYWVPQGRATVRRVLTACTLCKRRSKAPLMVQQMAPMLPEQVEGDRPPFTSTGVDCFGPIAVKCRRSTVKRWGCLFTCLTSRAVHLEVLHGMSANNFVSAFHRFVARRGRPTRMYSDNGSNFIGGEREMREAWEDVDVAELTRQFADHHVEWVFNPAHASHRGGATERLIRSVRDVLTPIVNAQTLSDEQLMTVFAEAERVVNSRPLTRASSDINDDSVITPQDLLLPGSGSTCAPPGVFDADDRFVRRWWRQAQYLADVFWQRWLREYLPTLHARQKWHRELTPLKVGDVVIVKDLDVARGHWPLGRVTATHDSQDKLVRSVDVLCRGKTLRRPVTQLCFLETDC